MCSIYFFLNSANMIGRGTDISKYFRQSLRLRENESRLYKHKIRNRKNNAKSPHRQSQGHINNKQGNCLRTVSITYSTEGPQRLTKWITQDPRITQLSVKTFGVLMDILVPNFYPRCKCRIWYIVINRLSYRLSNSVSETSQKHVNDKSPWLNRDKGKWQSHDSDSQS